MTQHVWETEKRNRTEFALTLQCQDFWKKRGKTSKKNVLMCTQGVPCGFIAKQSKKEPTGSSFMQIHRCQNHPLCLTVKF